MRIILTAIAALGFLTGTSDGTACSKCGDKQTTQTAHPAAASDKAPVPVNNTLCPVTDAKVGSMEAGAKLVYKEHEIGLCCSGCKDRFMKDPEAGLKKAQQSASKQ